MQYLHTNDLKIKLITKIIRELLSSIISLSYIRFPHCPAAKAVNYMSRTIDYALMNLIITSELYKTNPSPRQLKTYLINLSRIEKAIHCRMFRQSENKVKMLIN